MLTERIDPAADAEVLRALYEIPTRASRHDTPETPPLSLRQFRGWRTYGQGGEPMETWVGRAEDCSQLVGGYTLVFFDTDNTHAALVKPVVDPDERRRGYGSVLLEHAAGRARAAGRRLVIGDAARDSPGSAFGVAVGAEPGLDERERVLDLDRADRGAHARLLGEARAAARAYTLLRWEGPAPDEHLDGVAALLSQMSDAPVGDLRSGAETVELTVSEPGRPTRSSRNRGGGAAWGRAASPWRP